MRNAFADELTRLADDDQRVVMLSGDIGFKLFDKFKAKHKGRFFNCGVAEQGMTGMAAGLALCGLRPITYTITPFVTTRCLEQIRIDVCYHRVPVVIAGVGAGLSYASLGATHHALEDIAMLRSLPEMTVVCPADSVETRLALRAAIAWNGPVYLRLGKKGEPDIHGAPPAFAIGQSITVRHGKDICLLGVGTLLPEVLKAAERLAAKGVSAEVVSFHTIKPLDERRLKEAFSKFPLVVTAEEHSRIGGLGGAVAEWLSDHPAPASRLLRLGAGDRFIREAGGQEHARKLFGLDAEGLAASAFAAYEDARSKKTA